MKKRNLFITLGLALGLGVAGVAGLAQGKEAVEVKADATYYDYYVAISDSYIASQSYSNVTIKSAVHFGGQDSEWEDVTADNDPFSDSNYAGYTIYKARGVDYYGGHYNYLVQILADGTWKEQKDVYSGSGWDTTSYAGKLFVYDTQTWVSNYSAPAPIYSIIGYFGDHNWDYDLDFVTNSNTNTATLTDVELKAGETFKIRKNHRWAKEYGFSNLSSIDITDPLDRGEPCIVDSNNQNNIKVEHNGTYTITLNYSSATPTIEVTGTRSPNDSNVPFLIWYKSGSSAYASIEMELKPGSDSEYMIELDIVSGDLFYFQFGEAYYHYENIKGGSTSLKDKQFVANGEVCEALFSGNYTIYFESDTSSEQFGGWLQFNSVSAAQIADNLVGYAQYFNSTIKGVCDPQGKDTVISDLQSAWQSVYTRYNNAPADVKTAIAGATEIYDDTDVKAFVAKYASVYRLRGADLGSQGGDFLSKNITPIPSHTFMPSVFGENSNSLNAFVIITIATMALVTVGGVFLLRRKEN